MPIYEYRCSSCDMTLERRQKFSDPPLTVCDVCGGPLERLISAPGLQFKGSGWYITDYARGAGGKNGGKSDGPATKAAEAPKSEPKTEKSTAAAAKAD